MHNNKIVIMFITFLFINNARPMENIKELGVKNELIRLNRNHLKEALQEVVEHTLKEPINAQFLEIIKKGLSDFDENSVIILKEIENKARLIDEWIILISAHRNNDPYVLARHIPVLFTKKTINSCAGAYQSLYHYPAYKLLDSKALNRAIYHLNCDIVKFIPHITRKLNRFYYTEFTENTYSYANEFNPLFVRVNGKNYVETHHNQRDPVVFIAKEFWEDALSPDFQLYSALNTIEKKDFLERMEKCAPEIEEAMSFIKHNITIRGTSYEILQNDIIIQQFFVDFTSWYTKAVKEFEKQSAMENIRKEKK